jgi:hypothetical protein
LPIMGRRNRIDTNGTSFACLRAFAALDAANPAI